MQNTRHLRYKLTCRRKLLSASVNEWSECPFVIEYLPALRSYVCCLCPIAAQEDTSRGPTRRAGPTHAHVASSTRATLPPHSPADVQFMQDMIMHHAQAVEMTALIDSHTENKELRSLGARISRSQVRRNKVYETMARGAR